MSDVTGVVLCLSASEETSHEDGPPVLVETINAWMRERGQSGLAMVEDHFGGGKHPQMFVAGGAMNGGPRNAFATFVMSLPWRLPENVVLVMQPEEGKTWVFSIQD